MKTVWAKLGQPIALPCSLREPNENNYSLEWRKDSNLIFTAYGDDPGHTVPNMQGRLARAASLGLTIHSVELTDQATYFCAVTKFAKGAKATSEKGPITRLLVHSIPIIRYPINGREVFASLGEKIEIHCIAIGVPLPEIVWIKNGKVVSETAILSFSNLTPYQEGTYTCQASNSEGQSQATISLNFSKEASITIPLEDKVVTEGKSVFWHCHAQAIPSNITYRWLYENRSINSLEVGLRSHIQDGDFGITSVSRRDRGRYTCEATNGFGSTAISSTYLDVHYKPEIRATSKQIYIFGIGMNGTVECEVDANPPITLINWTKNGQPISDISDTILEMVNASEKDSGLYACQAKNAIGSSLPFEMHVIVAALPSFSIIPPEKLLVKAGESIEVECNGYGDPPPTQYWLHKTKKITSAKLVITNVSHSDHGLYKCVLVNPVGTVSKELNLFVKNTYPQCIESLLVECEGETNLQVSWLPGYDGGSTQKYRAFHRKQGKTYWISTRYSNETQISLRNLEPFSINEIQIEASNSLGAINCSSVFYHVCSKLMPPKNLRLVDGKILQWDRIPEATSYKVSYRRERGSRFRDIMEVQKAEALLELEALKHAPEIELRVRSVRKPLTESEPSDPIVYYFAETSSLLTYCIIGGLIFLLLLFIFYVFVKRQSKTSTKIRKLRPSFGNYACDMNVHLYERKDNADLHIDDQQENPWNLRDDRYTKNNDELNDSFFDSDFDNGAIAEMFKEKYIYSENNQRLDVLDEIRIARLKREFGQTQL